MRRIRINQDLFHETVAETLASGEQKLWETFQRINASQDFIGDARGHDSAKGNVNPALNRDLAALHSAIDEAGHAVEAAYAKLVELQKNQQRVKANA